MHTSNPLRVISSTTHDDDLLTGRQIWSETAAVDLNTQLQGRRLSAVVNYGLVPDPMPPGNLPRHSWTLLNRFGTGQGPRRANLHIKWNLSHQSFVNVESHRASSTHVQTPDLTWPPKASSCRRRCSQLLAGYHDNEGSRPHVPTQ